MTTSDLLRLDNISKRVHLGETPLDILKGVSLSLASGEFMAVMGASGSGKSTLLNVVGLLDTPSSGSVFLKGQKIGIAGEDELAALRSRTIGFIFQSFQLLPYLTALENVTLPLLYCHRANGAERAYQLLGQMQLQHRAHAYPATLSGGERQRVAIARALVNEPALLLADEPTGALDSATGTQIMEVLRDLHRRGSTIVLVTHDEKIAQNAERIVVMKDGCVVEDRPA